MFRGLKARSAATAATLAMIVIGALVVAACGGTSSNAAAFRPSHRAPSAAVPTVEGPVPNPSGAMFANYPLSQVGYGESEYFFSGNAASYSSATPLTSGGKWTVQRSSLAPYKSRLIVLRPTDPARFSGTVVVEWFNVTSNVDEAVDWLYGHDEMIRSGDVYVGVSAQAVGLNELKKADPTRYGSLAHPGDSYSYDIFSQAGMAVRDDAPKILGGLKPLAVIADGESQSAIRMTTYVDAVTPLVNVYDGYLIHSRAGQGAALSQAPQTVQAAPTTQFIRTDLTVPVLDFQTETDVLGVLAFYPATQADSKYFRLWEVAGTSHVDTYIGILAADDNNTWASDLSQFASMASPPHGLTANLPTGPLTLSCPGNLNTGEEHYVYQTALHDLVSWVSAGVAPRDMPRLDVNAAATPPLFRVDRNGNVLGGIRTPAVDAPVAVLSGLIPAGSPGFCEFFGQTHPIPASHLAALYPTHGDFVRAWNGAVAADLKAGYLLPADAKSLAAVVSGS